MKDHGQFGDKPDGKPAQSPSDQLDCAAVDLLWVEAVEGTLPPPEAEKVRVHTAECAACRGKIFQARKGREWLLVLKQEPLIPPGDLVAKILAKTAGAQEVPAHPPRLTVPKFPVETDTRAADRYSLPGYSSPDHQEAAIPAERPSDYDGLGQRGMPPGVSVPVWQRPSVVFLRKTVFDPRVALVAAMAFFSISLTLNLMGVKLTRIRPADLKPQAMRRVVTRQYAQANARVVHYYENLRIVYEVESRVHQLRQAAESVPVPEKTSYPQGEQGAGADRNGQGHRSDRDKKSDRDGLHRERMNVIPVKNQNAQRNHATPVEPEPIFSGPAIEAYLNAKPSIPNVNAVENGRPKLVTAVFPKCICRPDSQASSRLFQFACFSMLERNSA